MPNNYSSEYGGIPALASSDTISSQIQGILNRVIPGFSGAVGSAADYTKKLLSGVLSPETKNAIQDSAATWGASTGMPGFNPSTLGFNRGLKNIGLTSLGQQQQGLGNLLQMLQGFSGSVAPNFSQAADQSNTAEEYASAPSPAANIEALTRRYLDAMNPASGRAAGFQPESRVTDFNSVRSRTRGY